jgi:transposase
LAVAATPLSTPSTPVLVEFRAQLAGLMAKGHSDDVVDAVMTLVERLTADNSQLAQRLHAALRMLYKKKSERISPDQLALFLALLPAAEAALAKVDGEPATPDGEAEPAPTPAPAAAERKKPGRKPLPDHLRREIKLVAVAEQQRACSLCGAAKQPMGYEPQLRLEYKPAEFYLVEERCEIIVCKTCQEGVVTAPATPKPIEGGRPGASVLAQIVTAKLRDCLPLYRQSEIYRRSGVDLAPSTLGDWFAAAGDEAQPIVDHFRRVALEAYLLSLDDTGQPVLDRDHPRGIKRGHLWTFVADAGRVGFCEYTPDWKGEHPAKILAGFRGTVLQGDGYAGLDDLFTRPRRFGDEVLPPPVRAGCMDHARRRWVVALEAGDARAAVGVALFRQLYAVEAAARAAGDDATALLRRRKSQSRLIMTRLQEVIAGLYGRAVPKSPLGKALTYAIHQWPTLVVFLDDPRVPISNILVEQLQRRPVLSRKNYLFAGSDEAGRRIANLQTLAVNCALAGAPMFEYLTDLFAALAGRVSQDQLAELTPAAWLAKQRPEKPQAD